MEVQLSFYFFTSSPQIRAEKKHTAPPGVMGVIRRFSWTFQCRTCWLAFLSFSWTSWSEGIKVVASCECFDLVKHAAHWADPNTLPPSHLQALVAPLSRCLQILELLRGWVEGGGGTLVRQYPAVRDLQYGTEALQGPLLLLQELALLLLLLLSLQQPGKEVRAEIKLLKISV